MVEVSVVVPVYNSEACLAELHRQTADALQGRAFELILVDDQSTDGSWRAIERLCAADSAVVGVRLRKNAGQDNAILCGLRLARGDFAAIMDDDLQHSPYDIPALLAGCAEQELDVCYARFAVKQHALWKNLGSWLNGKLAEIVIGKPKGLYLSPFKAVRRAVVEEIAKHSGPFPYVDGLLLSTTAALGQVEVAHHARFRGCSQFGLGKSLLTFLRVATGFSVWPLRFASCVGLVLALLGFALALFYLLQYLLWERHVEGWITLVILQLLIGGTLLFSLGVAGEYLGRLYLTCTGKPQATVREVRRG